MKKLEENYCCIGFYNMNKQRRNNLKKMNELFLKYK